MTAQTAQSGETDCGTCSSKPAKTPAKTDQDASDKVVQPFAQQTQRPQ